MLFVDSASDPWIGCVQVAGYEVLSVSPDRLDLTDISSLEEFSKAIHVFVQKFVFEFREHTSLRGWVYKLRSKPVCYSPI
jgi:hypothetical protein